MEIKLKQIYICVHKLLFSIKRSIISFYLLHKDKQSVRHAFKHKRSHLLLVTDRLNETPKHWWAVQPQTLVSGAALTSHDTVICNWSSKEGFRLINHSYWVSIIIKSVIYSGLKRRVELVPPVWHWEEALLIEKKGRRGWSHLLN